MKTFLLKHFTKIDEITMKLHLPLLSQHPSPLVANWNSTSKETVRGYSHINFKLIKVKIKNFLQTTVPLTTFNTSIGTSGHLNPNTSRKKKKKEKSNQKTKATRIPFHFFRLFSSLSPN